MLFYLSLTSLTSSGWSFFSSLCLALTIYSISQIYLNNSKSNSLQSARGESVSSSDMRTLESKAKEKLSQAIADADSSRHVFISFAYEDLDEVNLLRGHANNDKTDLEFDDFSVKEAFDSKNADYLKRQIREKIDRC